MEKKKKDNERKTENLRISLRSFFHTLFQTSFGCIKKVRWREAETGCLLRQINKSKEKGGSGTALHAYLVSPAIFCLLFFFSCLPTRRRMAEENQCVRNTPNRNCRKKSNREKSYYFPFIDTSFTVFVYSISRPQLCASVRSSGRAPASFHRKAAEEPGPNSQKLYSCVRIFLQWPAARVNNTTLITIGRLFFSFFFYTNY